MYFNFNKDSSHVTHWPPIKEKILILQFSTKNSQSHSFTSIMKYPQTVSMPSAVSIWLEEQLEARGIDAVVYTRYILSLLHSHTVDVIYSEEDLQFSALEKEVGKWSRGRKRSRRPTSDWWRHAHANAEHIKRSAAVECLLSATDQNCEVESLIDELCEKLKRSSDESDAASPPAAAAASPSTDRDDRKLTPLELAEKYYAAFPPLCPPARPLQESGPSTPEGSPKKKGAAARNKLRSKEKGDIMKARCPDKQRYSYFSRSKMAASRHHVTNNNWDLRTLFINKKFSVAPAKPTSRSEMRDHCLDENRCLWDSDVNMYEDLPVDIKELLDSPSPQYDNVELMNMANMKDDGRREYIPYGANIMSSIWSTDQDVDYDNNFNSAIDGSNSDLSLGFNFSSISIDARPDPFGSWPTTEASAQIENEKNAFSEDNEQQLVFAEGFRSLPSDWGESDDEKLLNRLASSLMKLNHSRERSGFTEVAPGAAGSKIPPYNPFGRSAAMFDLNARPPPASDEDTEDLLTSESSHFKPIAAETSDTGDAKKYADGATFVISNNLEKVEYKRSESGTMWLDDDNGPVKRYYTYKGVEMSWSPDLEFVLKFSIRQNDKACQTEEVADNDADIGHEKNAVDNTTNKTHAFQPLSIEVDDSPVPLPLQEENDGAVCATRPDSAPLWKYQEVRACSKCSDDAEDSLWARGGGGGGAVVGWGGGDLRDIWSGGEICQTCLNGEDELPRPAPSLRLREDISQDGEQLLSDLSSLQRSYMDDLPPISETTRDLSELLATPKERKRRHSFMLDHDEWSFASRLEEDCLIQISALPSLRSITF